VVSKEEAIKEALRITRTGGKFIVIEPNLSHPQRRLTSNPKSLLRRLKILSRFIGPVETFQTGEQVIECAEKYGGENARIRYYSSLYNHLTPRQFLQKVYAFFLKPFVRDKYRLPNYFISFEKCAEKLGRDKNV
jgi:hypothetical protein